MLKLNSKLAALFVGGVLMASVAYAATGTIKASISTPEAPCPNLENTQHQDVTRPPWDTVSGSTAGKHVLNKVNLTAPIGAGNVATCYYDANSVVIRTISSIGGAFKPSVPLNWAQGPRSIECDAAMHGIIGCSYFH